MVSANDMAQAGSLFFYSGLKAFCSSSIIHALKKAQVTAWNVAKHCETAITKTPGHSGDPSWDCSDGVLRCLYMPHDVTWVLS